MNTWFTEMNIKRKYSELKTKMHSVITVTMWRKSFRPTNLAPAIWVRTICMCFFLGGGRRRKRRPCGFRFRVFHLGGVRCVCRVCALVCCAVGVRVVFARSLFPPLRFACVFPAPASGVPLGRRRRRLRCDRAWTEIMSIGAL